MKIIKKLALWLVCVTILELVGFTYVNNHFLAKETTVTTKNILREKLSSEQELSKIPEGASEINISCDGKYMCYSQNNELRFMDLASKKEEIINPSPDSRIVLNKWVEGIDNLLIIEQSTKTDNTFSVCWYNVLEHIKNKPMQLSNDLYNKYLKLQKVKIENVSISSGTESFILQTIDSKGKKRINTVTFNGSIGYFDESKEIENIYLLNSTEKFIYEDRSDGKIKAYDSVRGEVPLDTSKLGNAILLKVDKDDNVFIGSLKDNKINKIYYKSMVIDNDSFKIIDLKKNIDRINLITTFDGNNYEIKRDAVKNLKNNKEYKFKGQFLQISNNNIFSIDNGYLFKTSLQ